MATSDPTTTGGKGKAGDKIEALESAGVRVSKSPAAMGETLKEIV